METKVCSKCGSSRRLASNGRWICDPCNRARATAYRIKNIETVRAKDRARVAEMSPEAKRAKHKKWRDANLEYVREYGRSEMRKLYYRDPERFREKSRLWVANNPEKARESRKKNYEKHRDERIAYSKRYREENPDRVKRAQGAWRKKNPETTKKYKARQRDELHDSYVKRVLTGSGSIKLSSIPQSLIEAKRVQLQIKRLLKEKTK